VNRHSDINYGVADGKPLVVGRLQDMVRGTADGDIRPDGEDEAKYPCGTKPTSRLWEAASPGYARRSRRQSLEHV
ncbi:MAG: hypothetical protein R6V12_03865, partial [Candidatus Hydrogenedentota bacterium]